MQKFKPNDKVFCPSISNKPFILQCRTFGVLYIVYDNKTYSFNECGYGIVDTYGGVLISVEILLVIANETTCQQLNDKYGVFFILDIDVDIYAIRYHTGRDTFKWLTKKYFLSVNGSEERVIEHPPKNVNLIKYLRDNEAFIGINRDELKTIPQGYQYSIICVGRDSINNWSN